eukprot:634064-Amphidinium_carterae.1
MAVGLGASLGIKWDADIACTCSLCESNLEVTRAALVSEAVKREEALEQVEQFPMACWSSKSVRRVVGYGRVMDSEASTPM